MENQFKHEFDVGIGYKGKIVVDNDPSFWDNIWRRKPHYEQVFIEVYDFEKETVLENLETKRIRKSRFARIQMAHSLRKQEEKAWELCKKYTGRELIFSSAIEDGLISDS